MKNSEKEMFLLKEELYKMWELVIDQLQKVKTAFLDDDTALALEIISREKRVNAFELKVDSNCENYIALFSPVAIDLRLVLSTLKIGIFLERIGDLANTAAKHVMDQEHTKFYQDLKKELDMEVLFDTLIAMLTESLAQFQAESTTAYETILTKKHLITQIYQQTFLKVADLLKTHQQETVYGLKTILLLHKLERVGDYVTNILEETVFYVEAKVLKHKGKTADPDSNIETK